MAMSFAMANPRLLGALTALLTLGLDQANKLWLIFDYGIETRQPVRLTSFFDVIYAKNPGISYSLLSAHTQTGRIGLLVLTLSATLLLGVWLWNSNSRLICLSLGLIIGGALGNAYDRLAYGYVADFYYFHLGSFSWYVFNLADAAIVLGVGLLLCDSFFGKPVAASLSQKGRG
jgi:signal peptidase II